MALGRADWEKEVFLADKGAVLGEVEGGAGGGAIGLEEALFLAGGGLDFSRTIRRTLAEAGKLLVTSGKSRMVWHLTAGWFFHMSHIHP